MTVTVRYKKTGKVVEVTRNEAFELIDSGLAEKVAKTPKRSNPQEYTTRQIRSKHIK